VDLNTFIVSVFCLVDDSLKGQRLRSRGPAPRLSDSEVLTIEIVGEFLGLDTDKGIYLFFRRHYREWFPALSFLPSARYIGPPSPGRRPTSGGSRSASGKSFSASLLTTQRLPSATRCPCQFACLPAPTVAIASKEKPLSARTSSSSRPSTALGCILGFAGRES
jgi:hypothetical protein